MSNPEIDPAILARREASNQARRRFARTIMVGGVTCWIGLMSYIIYLDQTGVRVSYGALVAVTILCWVVFFIGKTILKYTSEGDQPHREG